MFRNVTDKKFIIQNLEILGIELEGIDETKWLNSRKKEKKEHYIKTKTKFHSDHRRLDSSETLRLLKESRKTTKWMEMRKVCSGDFREGVWKGR